MDQQIEESKLTVSEAMERNWIGVIDSFWTRGGAYHHMVDGPIAERCVD